MELEDPQDFVAGDEGDLEYAVGVTEDDTDLQGG